jgi:hypothetical protein
MWDEAMGCTAKARDGLDGLYDNALRSPLAGIGSASWVRLGWTGVGGRVSLVEIPFDTLSFIIISYCFVVVSPASVPCC